MDFVDEEPTHRLTQEMIHTGASPWDRWRLLQAQAESPVAKTTFNRLRDMTHRVRFLAELPFAVPMHYTLGLMQHRDWFYGVFLGSLAYLLVLVTLLLSWLTRTGCVMGISDAVMGITLGAAATSMPDCLVSLHVARQGQGTMTVANVLGSNVFDVLFALGVPWVIATVFMGKEIRVEGGDIESSLLVGLFFFFCASLMLFRFRQGPQVGKVYIGMYLAFIIFAFVYFERTDEKG